MKVVTSTGQENLAVVYIAETADGKAIEFVESVQPPVPREKKWVLIVSTLFGCPIKCSMCDAGDFYKGKLSVEEIFFQIDHMVNQRFPDGRIDIPKFKIQFARMGDPGLNPNVLDVLRQLPRRYDAPGLMPCLSTIAPKGSESFLEQLLEIKKELYNGNFQLQFSVHTTDDALRDRMIPVKKLGFAQIAGYGERFCNNGERKITLNFALEKDAPVDAALLKRYFNPDKFLIKITPINPTYRANESQHKSYIDPLEPSDGMNVVSKLRDSGYEVLLSVGENDENYLGSNCGQLILNHMRQKTTIGAAYSHAATDTIRDS